MIFDALIESEVLILVDALAELIYPRAPDFNSIKTYGGPGDKCCSIR